MTYSTIGIAAGYDALNALLWFPTGGSSRLRQTLVDLLDVRPGDRVLELGAGTGQVTRRLVAAHADVVAVDQSSVMLRRASRRAPQATFVRGDVRSLESLDVGTGFDIVVVAFLLHELPARERLQVLRAAAAALGPGGRIGVLEWHVPTGRLRRRLWRGLVRAIEPPSALEVRDGRLDSEIAATGLRVETRQRAAGERAEIMLLTRCTP